MFIFGFICVSFGSRINIVFSEELYKKLNETSEFSFDTGILGILNTELKKIEISDRKNSEFVYSSKFLENYDIFDESDNDSNDIYVPWKISYIKFLIDFVDNGIEGVDINPNKYTETKFIKIINGFIDEEVNSRNFDNIIIVVNYLIQVFEYFCFDSEKIMFKFYMMLFSYFKSQNLENLEWLSIDWNSTNFVLINFPRIMSIKKPCFDCWSNFLVEYYDCVAYNYLVKTSQHSQKDETFVNKLPKFLNELHLSKKLKRIFNILDEILKYTIVERIYIDDYYSYDKVVKINNMNPPIFLENENLKVKNYRHINNLLFTYVRDLRVDIWHEEDVSIDKFKDYSVKHSFPNLRSFYSETLVRNGEVLTEIFRKLPLNLKELRLKDVKFSLEEISRTLRLYEPINYSTIELDPDVNVGIEMYLNTIREHTKNNINIIYIDYLKFPLFDFHTLVNNIELFENIEYLVIRISSKVMEGDIEMYKRERENNNRRMRKLKCLINVIDTHPHLYECEFVFLTDDFDPEILLRFKRDLYFKIVTLDNINLKDFVVNEMISKIEVRELIIKNSYVPATSFIDSLDKSVLGYFVDMVAFENVVFEDINSLVNFRKIYLNNLRLINVNFKGNILDFDNSNLMKYYINGLVIINSNILEEDLKKFMNLMNINEGIVLVELDFTPGQLQYIFNNDKSYEKVWYKPKKRLTKKDLVELNKIKTIKMFFLRNYDQEFEVEARKENKKNVNANVRYNLLD